MRKIISGALLAAGLIALSNTSIRAEGFCKGCDGWGGPGDYGGSAYLSPGGLKPEQARVLFRLGSNFDGPISIRKVHMALTTPLPILVENPDAFSTSSLPKGKVTIFYYDHGRSSFGGPSQSLHIRAEQKVSRLDMLATALEQRRTSTARFGELLKWASFGKKPTYVLDFLIDPKGTVAILGAHPTFPPAWNLKLTHAWPPAEEGMRLAANSVLLGLYRRLPALAARVAERM